MEELLIKNIRQFSKSASLVYFNGDYTSSAILYFKTLFAICDLIIYRKIGRIPKDHSERFRLLEESFSELYKIVDLLYPDYRSTYRLNLTKQQCDRVKNEVERIIKEQRIF